MGQSRGYGWFVIRRFGGCEGGCARFLFVFFGVGEEFSSCLVEVVGFEVEAVEDFGGEHGGEDVAGEVAGGDEVGEESEGSGVAEFAVDEGRVVVEDEFQHSLKWSSCSSPH